MNEITKLYIIHDFTEFLIEKGFNKIDYDNLTDFELEIQEDEESCYFDLPFNEKDRVLKEFVNYIIEGRE